MPVGFRLGEVESLVALLQNIGKLLLFGLGLIYLYTVHGKARGVAVRGLGY